MRKCIFLIAELCLKHLLQQCLISPGGRPWDTWRQGVFYQLGHRETPKAGLPGHSQISHTSTLLWQMNRWISAGAFDGFVPEEVRISWQIAARSWFDRSHSWNSHQSRPKPISGCLDIWSLGFTWSIQGMPSFRSKISARVICVATAGTFKSLWWLWPFLTGGNQFPIMNTLSSDGSERGLRFEKLPQFSAVFSICRLNWGRIAHLEPRLKN